MEKINKLFLNNNFIAKQGGWIPILIIGFMILWFGWYLFLIGLGIENHVFIISKIRSGMLLMIFGGLFIFGFAKSKFCKKSHWVFLRMFLIASFGVILSWVF